MSRRRCCCQTSECFAVSECMSNPTASYAYVTLPSGWEDPARAVYGAGCYDIDDCPIPSLAGSYVLTRTSPLHYSWKYVGSAYSGGFCGQPQFQTWNLWIEFGLNCTNNDCYWSAAIWIAHPDLGGSGSRLIPCSYWFDPGDYSKKTRSGAATWTVQLQKMYYYTSGGVSQGPVSISLPLVFTTTAP